VFTALITCSLLKHKIKSYILSTPPASPGLLQNLPKALLSDIKKAPLASATTVPIAGLQLPGWWKPWSVLHDGECLAAGSPTFPLLQHRSFSVSSPPPAALFPSGSQCKVLWQSHSLSPEPASYNICLFMSTHLSTVMPFHSTNLSCSFWVHVWSHIFLSSPIKVPAETSRIQQGLTVFQVIIVECGNLIRFQK
jgi:hypothetical protein